MNKLRSVRCGWLLVLGLLAGCAPAVSSRPAVPAPGVQLARDLDSIFADSSLAHAHWGIAVRSLQGEWLYRRQPDKLFLPASNMKLVTGAVALEALGPEFRFRTQVFAAGPVRDGTLRGDLLVRGAGDPTFSARFGGDPRAPFRAWADSLRARGITRIAGGIVGIDSVFDQIPLGSGWAWDDLDAYYAAEISGLGFNEGVVDVSVFPSRTVGAPGVVSLDPPTSYVRVINRTVTVPAGQPGTLGVSREPAGPGIVVTGQIPADTSLVKTTAIRDPTLFFVNVLRETLRDAGIVVEGPAVDADEFPDGVSGTGPVLPLFTHQSVPLREILPAFLKPSQNQMGEMLLRTLGGRLRGTGTARAGAAVVDSVIATWGLDPGQLVMADGSGLSRYNLVAPDLLIALLDHMVRGPYRDVWYAALPVAGRDGTLRSRLQGTPAEARVFAKTGTLSHVRALSGYAFTADGEPVLFSVLVNNHARSSRDVDRIVDAALVHIVNFRRSTVAAPLATTRVH